MWSMSLELFKKSWSLCTNESLSFINITGRGSQALLDNCTFRENCVITSNFSKGIVVSNSTFQLYKHEFNSIIVARSSAVTLRGNVNFTDSVTGINRPLIHLVLRCF